MSNDPVFDQALAFVLSHEGSSYVDDPADPGGATKFGISLHELQALGHLAGLDIDINRDGHVDARDIAALTQDEAALIYREAYWDKWAYGRINDPSVAAKVFDLAVNMGPGQAHRMVQRAIRSAWVPTAEDGILGSQTLSAINAASPAALYAALKSEAAGFYRWLAATKPALGKFLDGWLNRAYSNPGAAQ
jgi:lysozyme family protein